MILYGTSSVGESTYLRRTRELRERTYVICKLMYNGEAEEGLYGSSSTEPSHSLASVSNTLRAINTAPVVQIEQPVEENTLGMSMDDLVNPVNVQEDLFYPNTMFSNYINPNVQTQMNRFLSCNGGNYEDVINNTAPDQFQVQQSGEENTLGMSMDDLVNPVNVQADLPLADGFYPNTLLSDNINLNMQPQTPYDDAYFDRLLQVQQSGEANLIGLSVNDLLMPMNEHNHFVVSNVFEPNTFLFGDYSNINPQLQTYDDDDFINELLYNGGNQDFIMQENRNEHRPKKALSGYLDDSSSDSDSDAQSISATSYQETTSLGSSVGSPIPSCSSTDSCKDLQTSADPSISKKTKKSRLTRRTVTSKQEVKQGTPRTVNASMDKESPLVKTEKKGLFNLEDAMVNGSVDNESPLVKTEKKGLFNLEDAIERNRKNPRYIYMVIGFILLLALTAYSISVYGFTTHQNLKPSDGS